MFSVSKNMFSNMKNMGMAAMIGLSSCTHSPEPAIVPAQKIIKSSKSVPTESSTIKLLSMLERGDRHAVTLSNVPKDTRVIKASEISKYIPDGNTGELFYQVYVGKADKAIRKAKGIKTDLVTVGQGVAQEEAITLAGGLKARENDYICAKSVDSLMNLAIKDKENIIKNGIGASAYKKLKQNEKDAVLSFLYNVQPRILQKCSSGKSFFEHLKDGEKGMVQAKFNVKASSDKASVGLAKRNLVQMLIFGNGKIYANKKATRTFKNQVKIIKTHEKGKEFLNEALKLAEDYGVNKANLERTRAKIFPKK